MKRPRRYADLPDFFELPVDEQDRIQKWIVYLRCVTRPLQESLERLAKKMDCSFQTARSKYYAWTNTGDWHVLINYARLPYESEAHRVFIEWWREMCLRHKTAKEAYRKFLQLWNENASIPGFGRRDGRTRLPSGFGYDSLIRHAPTRFEKKAFAMAQEQMHRRFRVLGDVANDSDGLSELTKGELIKLIRRRNRRFSDADLALWSTGIVERLRDLHYREKFRGLRIRCLQGKRVPEAIEFADWLLSNGVLKLFDGAEKAEVEKLLKEILNRRTPSGGRSGPA